MSGNSTDKDNGNKNGDGENQKSMALRDTDARQQRRCREEEYALEVHNEDSKRRKAAERQRVHRTRKNDEAVSKKVHTGENSNHVERDHGEENQERKKREMAAQRQQRCREKKRVLETEKHELRREKNTERQTVCRKRKCEERIALEIARVKQLERNAQKQKKYRQRDEGIGNLTRGKKVHRMKKKYCFDDNNGRINDGVVENYLGPMNVLCRHCNAKHFAGERVSTKEKDSFNDCCSHGAVIAASFVTYPVEMRELFDIKNANSQIFFKNIRSYNNVLSFASFNANLTNFAGRRPGPYCFMIQGQIYYQMNTGLYPEGKDGLPRYGQLFMIDADAANHCRMSAMEDLDFSILTTLDSVLRRCNKFVEAHYMMKEVIEIEEQKSQQSGTSMPEIKMVFNNRKKNMDKHRYNPQRTNEVAAVFSTTADGEIPESYVTIVNRGTKKLEFISSMHPHIEPWIYPLFYPSGLGGYDSEDKRLESDSRISRSAYVKNLIAIRNEFNPIFNGRKLLQQWVVDSYVKVERDRTTFIKNNQKKLRCETYQGLIDYLDRRGEEDDMGVGKIVILPSTFIGSPRNMAQNYQDAMAIVRKYGKPDLFITMTCNPRWREIVDNLLPGQQPCDRPDLVARVFELKKNYLVNMITVEELFGQVRAYVYVIEFQKRGLPHIHMLVNLDRDYKFTRPCIVDRFISAEIPDKDEQPDLYNIVMKNMIHGPCGDWCLVENRCSKHFPKGFQDETTMDVDGYPCYRRRDTDEYHEKQNGYVVDNRFVVPYCPEILLKLDCHCNVEVVSNIRAVKYFYKYIHKSHDAADVIITQEDSGRKTIEHDEIKQHIDSRYVGPVEACWRLLGKKLHDKSHSVIRLPIHLPNQQNLTINPGGEECAMDDILEQKNMLLDYFALNSRNEEARRYLYIDIPTFYTFDKKKINNGIRGWKRRQSNHKVIGRMYSVSPSNTELFHLRLLICNVRGAQSFEDFRTVNGKLCSTFTDACKERGLIEDDYEWTRAMTDGEVWMMPHALRQLYACILIHCQPLYPDRLWEEFKIPMSDDFRRNMTPEAAENKALSAIEKILNDEDKTLADYNNMPEILDTNEDMIEEIDIAHVLAKGTEQYGKLNAEQTTIVDEVLTNIENINSEDRSTCFFINGPGGSGKTFIYDTLWHLLIGRGRKVMTMAFTGIAATLLPKGKTVHKTFALPVPLYQDSTSNIKLNTKKARVLRETDVFIWDEAPMAPKYCLDVIDRLLRDIMDNDVIFGDKMFILGGDFRQLLPVLVGGTRSETVSLSIKYSHLWRFFRMFTLTQNMRTLDTEKDFSNYLIEMGNGTLNDDNDNLDLPEGYIADKNEDIVIETYGEVLDKKKYKTAAKMAILSARNEDVDEINQQVVNLLDIDTEKLYTSVDSTENCDNNEEINESLLPEYLNTLMPPSFPPHELRLRKFSIVMLIRNLNIQQGLCNGTRLLIIGMKNNVLKCEILTGDKKNEIVFINRIIFKCENEYPFAFTRRQFPIKLAFAMTINKSQGQTLDRIAIDLRRNVFTHGQLYVAMSRVRSWSTLKIYLGEQVENSIVVNPVFKELLETNNTD